MVMDTSICYYGNWLLAWVLCMVWTSAWSGDYTLGMDSESSCTKTHYYKAGDTFTASAKGIVHGGHCPLTFIQSGASPDGTYLEPCLSLCVKITSYTMESCQVKMAYHDGISDFTPVTFDCHTYPPVMWCSSKNDLKVTVSEMKDYKGEQYAITLEVKPFCGTLDQLTTVDGSIVAKPQTKQSSMSQTALIIGAVVGTISILFVLGWLMYCYKKRNTSTPSRTTSRHDRHVRGSTPNQTPNRYAPVERNPPSSLTSSDRGAQHQYLPDLVGNQANINNMADRRLYSPFQPPQPNRNLLQGPGQIQQKVLYSDIDHGPKPGDKWYPMTAFGPPASDNYQSSGMTQSHGPPSQMSQYLLQNQVYKYPVDGEMHTVPTDTRYVVYDFDYEKKPMERKYSGGKSLNNPYRQSPVKDIDRSQPREITPLRETVRVMPPKDKGRVAHLDSTTDQTSENEYDSSLTGSSDEETTTDDQMMAHVGRGYNFVPNFSIKNPPPVKPNSSNTRLYDPRNFQRIDNPRTGSQTPSSQVPAAQNDLSCNKNSSQVLSASQVLGASTKEESQRTEEPESPKEGPVPQVPPMPKEFQRPQLQQQPVRGTSPPKELPWPHGAPPPYNS